MRVVWAICLLAAAPEVVAAQRGSVRGVVLDSLRGGLLADAEVQLLDRAVPTQARVVRTDASGAFLFEGLATGSYAIGFLHPSLDSLGLDPPTRNLVIRDGEATSLTLLQPSGATPVKSLCRTVVPRDGMPPAVRHDTLAIVRTSRGAGFLRGRVTTSTGAPLADARVTVWGTGLETLSGSDGTFELDSVPAGSHTVVARAVGFKPYRAPVDVVPPDTALHNLALAPFSVALDTVRVRVPVIRETWRTGFDDRRREGQGEFLDDVAISRRNPMQLTDLLQGMRGVNVIPTGPLRKSAVMRGQSGSQCTPAPFVVIWTTLRRR